MASLAGKAVVVTGAGRGIGAAIAMLAAAEGARVVVNDRDGPEAEAVAARIRAAGGMALAVVADVASWDGALALIDRCVAACGAIDGLVNNAGVHYMARLEDEQEERLRALVEVNVLGTAFCGIHAGRRMLAQGGGSIVNVTSGAQAGMRHSAAYGMSKGAVASLTYGWALELAERGVRVNAVSPLGQSRITAASRAWLAAAGQAVADQTIAPEANAPLVCYLLSDAAAAVNGQVVRMQGRRLSLMTHPAILHPGIERDTWSVADVAAAFEQDLSARQLPLGTAEISVALRGHQASFQTRESTP